MLDFSGIQTEAYRLITENSNVLAEIKSKIKYLMIDEKRMKRIITLILAFRILLEFASCAKKRRY